MSSTPCSLAVHALILWARPPWMVQPMYSHEDIRGYIPHSARSRTVVHRVMRVRKLKWCGDSGDVRALLDLWATIILLSL
jgi:hypothetical protein